MVAHHQGKLAYQVLQIVRDKGVSLVEAFELARTLADREASFVHAAGIYIGGGLVLLTGDFRTGKSIFSAACAAAGLQVFSDDIILPGTPYFDDPRYLEAHTLIEYIGARRPERFRLLVKREDPLRFLVRPKYVAYMQKSG